MRSPCAEGHDSMSVFGDVTRDDRYQEEARGGDPDARLRAEGPPSQGDTEGSRARGSPRERRVQGGEGAPELPAGPHRPAPSPRRRALARQPRQDPEGQGRPRFRGPRAAHRQRRGDGVRDRDPRGSRSHDRPDLAVLAHREVPPQPRGGRHGRGEGAVRDQGVRDHAARDDARPGRRSPRGGLSPGLGSPSFAALPDFIHVALDASDLASDIGERLAAVPASAGVAQLLGPEGKNLLIARASNLRRWAATHLGAGRPPEKGKRPPTNLRPVASGLSYARTQSPFQQKLVYERLMARHVPLERRRDLKKPAWLHLDPRERFPRVSVRRREGEADALFGPFRDKRAADKARDALQREVPLRPCDYTFEPDPALPLGLGCLFAQVRSCAAPCLARTSEEDYRELAAVTASRVARGQEGFEGMPPWAGAAGDARGVVVDRTRGRVVLYPVADGRVLEEAAVAGSEAEIR